MSQKILLNILHPVSHKGIQ